jgi:ribosomal protein L11 methylase PrmA
MSTRERETKWRQEQLAVVVAERDRLRKLFDDAGQGEHNVLALVDHYQRNSMDAGARLAALTTERDRLRALVERVTGCNTNLSNTRIEEVIDACVEEAKRWGK